MSKMMISTFLNCSKRIAHGEERPTACSSFGPCSASRRAASAWLKPLAESVPRSTNTSGIALVYQSDMLTPFGAWINHSCHVGTTSDASERRVGPLLALGAYLPINVPRLGEDGSVLLTRVGQVQKSETTEALPQVGLACSIAMLDGSRELTAPC